MNKWMKIAACVVIGAAAFVLSGCGKDYSGTYMAEIGEKDVSAQIVEIEKANKEGYIIKPRLVGYDVDTSMKYGEGSYVPNPLFVGAFGGANRKEISHRIYDVKAEFFNRMGRAFSATEPNKNNTMIYSEGMGSVTYGVGSIKIDDKGNLIDETGELSQGWLPIRERKFVKVKDFKLDEVKKTLQEHVKANVHEKYDYEKSPDDTSKVNSIVFNDGKQKK